MKRLVAGMALGSAISAGVSALLKTEKGKNVSKKAKSKTKRFVQRAKQEVNNVRLEAQKKKNQPEDVNVQVISNAEEKSPQN